MKAETIQRKLLLEHSHILKSTSLFTGRIPGNSPSWCKGFSQIHKLLIELYPPLTQHTPSSGTLPGCYQQLLPILSGYVNGQNHVLNPPPPFLRLSSHVPSPTFIHPLFSHFLQQIFSLFKLKKCVNLHCLALFSRSPQHSNFPQWNKSE
ncbi:hypothetical protein AMECASPLE_014745 [Ameca splendens]|uniref:Uncharacterized protein n=1 Tax=Ameca splendens TaxID=208324 RepID=A0ABV0Y1J2_9TELE